MPCHLFVPDEIVCTVYLQQFAGGSGVRPVLFWLGIRLCARRKIYTYRLRTEMKLSLPASTGFRQSKKRKSTTRGVFEFIRQRGEIR
jgi:hypothetical protein